MGPIDYTSQLKNPFQSAVQGMQLGAGIQGIQSQQREEAFKAQQQQAALQQQQALMQQAQNAELARRKFFANPNPTMRDAAELASFIPESQAKAMQPYLEGMSKEQQQGTLKFNTEVLSALQNNPTVAIQLLRKRAEGEKNSGDPEEAALYERLADSAEKDGPAMAFKGLSSIVSALPGAKEMFEAAGKFGDEQRAKELQPSNLLKAQSEAKTKAVESDFAQRLQEAGLTEKNWNVKNLQNQINVRGAQLGLDRQRLAMDTQVKMAELSSKLNDVPESARKLINDAAVTAGATKQQAAQYNDLAGRIKDIGSAWGIAGSSAEWLKKATGEQGAVSALRQEFTRLKNSAAVSSLPPGPATDKDIAMVMEGFPPATANPAQLSSFLRGMAKLKDIESSVEGAKVDWLAGNRGSLTRARDTFQAGDYAVKPGETFTDFSSRVAKDVSRRYSGENSDLAKIPTKNNIAPANNVRSAADAILAGGR